jgi:uncharacterized membrane protein (DUF2068 family)
VKEKKHHDIGFLLIAVFKLVKGGLLFAVGIGMLSLLNENVMTELMHWAHKLQLETHRHFIQRLLMWLGLVQRRDIPVIVGTTFFYSTLLLTEGLGLLLEKVWAEYLTLILTASFIPVEVYGLTRHATVTRATVLTLNIFVVAYLAMRLRQHTILKRRL